MKERGVYSKISISSRGKEEEKKKKGKKISVSFCIEITYEIQYILYYL